MDQDIIIYIIELLGTFAFAISGIRHAAAKHFDWFGGYVCGIAVAIGGGTIRDVMLGTTPFWMTTPIYMICTAVALMTVVLFGKWMEPLKNAMMGIGITGMTVSHVLGCGAQKGKPEYYRGVQIEASLLPKVQVDIVVCAVPVASVIETAKKVLYTGHIGDGKIFVYDVEDVVKVRTGETGYDAMQDVE